MLLNPFLMILFSAIKGKMYVDLTFKYPNFKCNVNRIDTFLIDWIVFRTYLQCFSHITPVFLLEIEFYESTLTRSNAGLLLYGNGTYNILVLSFFHTFDPDLTWLLRGYSLALCRETIKLQIIDLILFCWRSH